MHDTLKKRIIFDRIAHKNKKINIYILISLESWLESWFKFKTELDCVGFCWEDLLLRPLFRLPVDETLAAASDPSGELGGDSFIVLFCCVILLKAPWIDVDDADVGGGVCCCCDRLLRLFAFIGRLFDTGVWGDVVVAGCDCEPPPAEPRFLPRPPATVFSFLLSIDCDLNWIVLSDEKLERIFH